MGRLTLLNRTFHSPLDRCTFFANGRVLGHSRPAGGEGGENGEMGALYPAQESVAERRAAAGEKWDRAGTPRGRACKRIRISARSAARVPSSSSFAAIVLPHASRSAVITAVMSGGQDAFPGSPHLKTGASASDSSHIGPQAVGPP